LSRVDQKLADWIRQVSVFCIEHGGVKCFHQWPAPTVFRYVAHHVFCETAFILADANGIQLVAFVWPDDAEAIQKRHDLSEPQFFWQTPKGGNALFIAEVVGNRALMPFLRKMILGRWKDAFGRRLFAYRHRSGKNSLFELPAGHLERFCDVKGALP
jgi:hypothetical protein